MKGGVHVREKERERERAALDDVDDDSYVNSKSMTTNTN